MSEPRSQRECLSLLHEAGEPEFKLHWTYAETVQEVRHLSRELLCAALTQTLTLAVHVHRGLPGTKLI